MATIPQVTNRRPVSGGEQPIVKLAGGSSLQEATNLSADQLKKFHEMRSKDEISRARSKFLVLKAEQDSAYDDDEEFDTIPDRYSKVMDEGFALASQEISDERLREQFVLEMEPTLETGKQRIQGLAIGKSHDYERSEINEELGLLERAAVDDAGDPVAIYEAISERVGSAAERNVISHEQAQKITESFRTRVAVNKIKALNVEDRLNALNSPWAENIPAHVTKQLRDEAKDELRLSGAQDVAYSLFTESPDLTLQEARATLEAKYQDKDPELYRDAWTQYQTLYREREIDTVERQRNLHDQLWEMVDSGISSTMIRTSSQYKNLWAELNVNQKQDILNWEKNNAAGITARQHSDRDVLMNLYVLSAQPDKGLELYQYLTENHSKLSAADFKTWAAKGATGLVGEEVKPLFSAHQQIEMTTQKWDDQERMDLIAGLNRRYFDFTDIEKRNPTADEVNSMLQDAMKEYETSGGFLWMGTEKPPYSMSEQQKIDAMFEIDGVRQQMAFASQFDRATRDKLIYEMYRVQFPDIFNEAVGKFQPGYEPAYQEINSIIMNLVRERVNAD
jgi:hypothetical protein